MPKQGYSWVYSPKKLSKPRVPAHVKLMVEKAALELVESVLKPKHIQAPPAPTEFQHNYLADIYTKWYRHYFYFCAKYNCPGLNALFPSFEAKFARMEYVGGNGQFNLAFMRYTGEWVELYQGLSLAECLTAIEGESYFHP